MHHAKSLLLLSAVGLLFGCGDKKPDPARAPKDAKPPTPAAVQVLPKGFVAVEGAGVHATGWPKQIRCLTDDAILVFVPGGEFISGLTDQQLKTLAGLMDLDPGPPEDPDERDLDLGALLPILIKISDVKDVQAGKMLTDEDLKELDKALKPQDPRADECQALLRAMGVGVIAYLQQEGKQIPAEDLKRWRADKRSLKALLDIPLVRKELQLTDRQVADALKPARTRGEIYKQRRAARIASQMEYLKTVTVPATKVRLEAFYIDRCEVTNRQYRKFMAEEKDDAHRPGIWYNTDNYNIHPVGKRKFYDFWQDAQRNHDDQPVTCVSAGDALAYAAWAGRSIPTRFQWERAAVGDGGRLFPWGSDFKPAYCKCGVRDPKDENRQGRPTIAQLWRDIREFRASLKPAIPARIGTHPHDVSTYGCFDMAGNVSEWVYRPPDKAWVFTGRHVGIGGSAGAGVEHLVPGQDARGSTGSMLQGFRTVLLCPRARK